MRTPKAPAADQAEERTIPRQVPEGREQQLSLESARAIADASTAAGFPVPPQAQTVIDAAGDVAPAPTAQASAEEA